MPEAALPILSTWSNFYVIIGTASATLMGLMFVVITLIAGSRIERSSEAVGVFGTPTVMHFCAALLIAALLNVPWEALWNVSLVLGLCGLSGVIYSIIVLWRARHQTDYQPVLEDWLWHTIFPFISYASIFAAALVLPFDAVPALFVIGAATVLFLFIGIHNAWDSVTYIIIERSQPEK